MPDCVVVSSVAALELPGRRDAGVIGGHGEARTYIPRISGRILAEFRLRGTVLQSEAGIRRSATLAQCSSSSA